MTASTCLACGNEVTRRRAVYCSKSCAGRSRSKAFQGVLCSAPECDRKVKSCGYCDMHYQRVRKHGDLRVAPWVEMTESERFWSKVDRGADSACWEWQGRRTRLGYGEFSTWRDGGRQRHYAHRYALTDVGTDVSGKVVMHSCDNPPCVNPSHLTPGTQADNIHDAMSKGRMDLSGLAIGQKMRRSASR